MVGLLAQMATYGTRKLTNAAPRVTFPHQNASEVL
jgi:hypothetical protein